ncbi:MAG: hypothetical protein SF051_00560 [Elusimicrobiota bacterium]|nr:hypothetical protein [Elusimicrobiota bacterium]
MDTLPALKQMEGTLSVTGDRATALKGKIEELMFRAQRISAAAKNNMPSTDTMFGYDLQHVRRDVRAFSQELTSLPTIMGSIERTATYDEKAVKFATGVMRMCTRLSQIMKSLLDCANIAHQHIRANDQKIEAWYMAQEVEELSQKAQGLPATANKIVILVSTPPAGAAPAAPAAPPATPPA